MITIEEKRKLYMGSYDENRQQLDALITEGIEKNRKGSCKIRFTDEKGNPIVGKKVKITQKTHDFKYGANLFMLDEFETEKDNEEYRRFFKEHFNAATVPFYWDGLEPNRGAPRFSKDSQKVHRRPAPDLCMEYCEQNGVAPKLHCLVYDKFVPQWAAEMSLEEVKAAYEERFRQISERYRGRMFEFEVINELLKEEEWGHKTKLSEERDILEWSFALARKYFPNETLVINEADQIPLIARQDYRNPYFMLLENTLQKGTSIDKIGIQHHMFTGADTKTEDEYEASVKNVNTGLCDPFKILKGLEVVAELGLPIEITEVTVPTLGDTEEDEDLQAEMLRLWYSIWFSFPLVDAIVYWNTVDGYAYSNDTWNENNCRGGLWHHDLTPKKSALMLKKLFGEIWHTDLELITDSEGYVEFKGFYGDYIASAEALNFNFGIHNNDSNYYEAKG